MLASAMIVGANSSRAVSKQLIQPFQPEIINVNISFSTQTPLTDTSKQAIDAIQYNGRKLFYLMTQRECETMLEVLASSCKLKSLNMSSRIQQNNGRTLIYLTGSARFFITPK
jgi:hypothetical protein